MTLYIGIFLTVVGVKIIVSFLGFIFSKLIMEYSDHYKRREDLLSNEELPTLGEIAGEWGLPFCNMLCENCPDSLKCMIGISPPLTGPGDDLWISPSDTLIGKVCLKPPLTSKHVQALTHEGILEIGKQIEQKFWNEMELDKKKALRDQEYLLKFMFQKEKALALSKLRAEERQLCADAMAKMSAEFAEKLAEELAALEEFMIRQREEMIREALENLEEEWEIKLERVVEETVNNLTKSFLETLQRHANQLQDIYTNMLKKERIKSKFALDMERVHCNNMMNLLRHNLECNNIANMMYLICIERHKCEAEKEASEVKYREEIENLKNSVVAKDVEIKNLARQRDEKQSRLEIREACILEILKQFQKFINFALRATPTQAEFLLNVEKMMLFELTKDVKKSGVNLKPEAPTMSLKSVTQTTEGETLSFHDYHDCYNETEPPSVTGTISSTEALPAMYYNDKMYVREDFRNMFSQGLTVDPDNMLWNKDVEHLMQLLKKSVSKMSVDENGSEKSAGSLEERLSNQDYKTRRRRSSVRFEGEIAPNVCHVPSVAMSTPKQSAMLRKPSLRYSEMDLDKEVDFNKIGQLEKTNALIATRSSVELLRLKKIEEAEETVDDLDYETWEDKVLISKKSSRESEEVETKDLAEKLRSIIKSQSSQENEEEDLFNIMTQEGTVSSSPKTILSLSDEEVRELRTVINADSRLNMTIDSIELMQEKISIRSEEKRRPHLNISKGSRISMARNSIELMKDNMKTSVERVLPKNVSKISMHKDSLDLLKSKSKDSFGRKIGSPVAGKIASDSIEVLNGIITRTEKPPSIVRIEECGSRTVRMSHIEVREIKDRRSSVFFDPKPIVLESYVRQDSVDKVYASNTGLLKRKRKSKTETFAKKPNRARIVGDPKGTEYLETSEEFTLHRIDSLMGLFQKNPSLIRMFTAGLR